MRIVLFQIIPRRVLCLCFGLAAALPAAANPLALPPDLPGTPFSAQEASFSGLFSNRDIRLDLQGNGFYYHGQIEVRGQTYPLQATRQGDGLSGTFEEGGQNYPLRLYYQNNALVMESGGRRHVLNKNADMPLAAAMPGIPENLREDYTQLSLRTGLDLHTFVAAIRYWLEGALTEKQAVYLIEAHLEPGAANLGRQLDRLEQLLREVIATTPMSSQESQGLHKLVELCTKGVGFFRDWQSLLQNLLRLRTGGDQRQLQQVAAANLPRAVKGSVAYLRDYMLLVRAAGHIQQLQGQSQTPAASLAPEKMLKWETLRNMSGVMRDGLEMFKEWRK